MVVILTKNSSEKSNAPHMPGVPPLGLTLIDALVHKLLQDLFLNWLVRACKSPFKEFRGPFFFQKSGLQDISHTEHKNSRKKFVVENLTF